MKIQDKRLVEFLDSLPKPDRIEGETIWEGTPPVSFEDFLTAQRYLKGEVIPSPNQMKICKAILGQKPSDLFDDKRHISRIVVAAGKGGGKDEIISLVFVYAVYLLLKLRNPRSYLQGKTDLTTSDVRSSGSSIDLLNVATSSGQAEGVFFNYFANKVLNCEWFKDNFVIKKSGRTISIPKQYEGMRIHNTPRIEVSTSSIIFPKGIRAFTLNSNSERLEGYNTFLWCMDEASGFVDSSGRRNAQAVYDNLNSSMKSRFGLVGTGLIISYPRSTTGDFTLQMYDRSQIPEGEPGYEDDLIGFKFTTWEMRKGAPTNTKYDYNRDGTPLDYVPHTLVNVPGEVEVEIPSFLASEFASDPADSEMRYMCLPPPVKHRFIEDVAAIFDTYDPSIRPMFSTSSKIIQTNGRRSIAVDIYNKVPITNKDRKEVKYFMAIDKSNINHRTVVMVGHTMHKPSEVYDEFNKVTWVDSAGSKLVIDGIAVWTPDPKQHIYVSHSNVAEVIVHLARYFGIHNDNINADHWDAALPDQLVKHGVTVNLTRSKNADWNVLKTAVLNRRILHGYDPELGGIGSAIEYDLTNLVREGSRIGFPKAKKNTESPDIATCMNRLLMMASDSLGKDTKLPGMDMYVMGPSRGGSSMPPPTKRTPDQGVNAEGSPDYQRLPKERQQRKPPKVQMFIYGK